MKRILSIGLVILLSGALAVNGWIYDFRAEAAVQAKSSSPGAADKYSQQHQSSICRFLFHEGLLEKLADKYYKKHNLTALEAFALAYEEAKKVTAEEPLLIYLGSSDDTNKTAFGVSNGSDGRRNSWSFSFGSAKGNLALGGSIHDGECTIVQVAHDDNNSLQKGKYHISDIKLDSPEAIRQAIKTLDLRQGDPLAKNDWFTGYHFTIAEVYPDPYSPQTLLVFRVTGISPASLNHNRENLRMQAFFAAQTGELVHAQEQTGYDEEGHSAWREVPLGNSTQAP